MKRRIFLQAGTGFAALGSFGRLYGAPSHARGQRQQSLAPPLTLSLDRLSIPSEMWDWIQALNALFNNVFSDPSAATAFLAKDPALVRDTLLGSAGNFYESFECKMIGAALDPAVRAIAASGDFDALIEQLGSMELIDVADKSLLADRLDEVLSSKQQALAALPNAGVEAVLSGADDAAASAAALVVGVNIAAIINIGALVNFAVFIAVYAWTQGPSPKVNGVFPNSKHSNGGRILKLDPALFSSYESAVQIARLTGNYALVEKSFDHVLGVEADAVTASIDRVFLVPRNMSNDVERDKVRSVIHDSLRRLYRA